MLALAIVASPSTTVVQRYGRWLVHGIGSEVVGNVFSFVRPQEGAVAAPESGLAIVTGSTGGIGREVCYGLAERGYTVVCAARDEARGRALAASIVERGGEASFRELRLDSPAATRRFATAYRRKPVAVLVNCGGVMGGRHSKAETMTVNLVSPVVLTLELLPSLRAAPHGRVVNVGSSSHLRAKSVPLLPGVADARDADLSAYAQSKLGLMQCSRLIAGAEGAALSLHAAHPGLVWTPMLRGFLGIRVAGVLDRTRLRRVFFREPRQGAATVLAASAAPRDLPHAYFVDGRLARRAAASPESRDLRAARSTWAAVIEPELRRLGMASYDFDTGTGGEAQ